MRSPRPSGPQLGDLVRNGDDKAGSGLAGTLQDDVAAMGPHQFGGDCQAKARAALPRRTLEGLEQPLADLRRDPGAIVADLDHRDAALAPGLQRDGAIGRIAALGLQELQGLDGIALQVGQHTD